MSERLGHATTSITLDIDSHVQPELDAHAATAVARLFDAEPDGDPGVKGQGRPSDTSAVFDSRLSRGEWPGPPFGAG